MEAHNGEKGALRFHYVVERALQDEAPTSNEYFLRKLKKGKKSNGQMLPINVVDADMCLLFTYMVVRLMKYQRPKLKNILPLFRLRQIFNGVFLKVNKVTSTCCVVSAICDCRYPNLKSAEELIYKRGFEKLNQRIALTDNSIVDQALGKHGIICVDELIHEIMTVGPHFKEANNFLWPFQLKAPLGGLKKKRNHYVEGGDARICENFINKLNRGMN